MTIPFPPIWMAAPPEVHSALLNFGGTPVGIEIAGASWKGLAAQYASGVAELEGILAQVQSSYQGPSADMFLAAHQPYLVWLSTAAMKAAMASAAHDEVATGYAGAVATMPTLGELAENHVVHGVLVGTNFFGCNTVPIGMNEADYVRMWIEAADVMTLWDATSTMAADSIPPTPMSPVLLAPGVGEASSAAATAAGVLTQAQGQLAGAQLTAADMIGTKLMVGKAATSPASVANKAPTQAQRSEDPAQQGLQPENMASSLMQQMASMAPSAGQSATSALQGAGPQQLLSSAPQLLSSAPQTLGQMLTNFTGLGSAGATPTAVSGSAAFTGGTPGFSGAIGSASAAMPVGFAGTGAIGGINPAGLTSLSGGAFGSGPTRPMLPATWGATATTATESPASAVRALAPVAGISSGTGGGGMMGTGAAGRRQSSNGSHAVTSYAADGTVDEAASEGEGAWTMTR